MTNERVLELKGVHNFRDYGGYAVSGGGRVREGLLFRSAQHGGATPDDLLKIGSIGLSTVVDLRGEKERRANPCKRPEGFAAQVLFHEGETAAMPPHLQAKLETVNAENMRAATADVYRSLPMRPGLLDIFARYFEALADRDGPSLVHCFAGKDRTGIAVALLHHILGVHEDDILDDYLLTNTVGDVEARIADGAEHVRKRYGDMSPETMRVIMGVAPEYLASAMDEIRLRYGSVDAYLEQELGVTAQMQDWLRGKYIS
jgi:protein tyrosine/serine phosphatase